jgi:hypothetical protein
VQHIHVLLDDFKAASGLGINVDKCVAVALHPTARPDRDIGFPIAAPEDMNRLLGGQISSSACGNKVWDLTLQQMRTRLRLGEAKTTNVLQRVRLTNAILVPKFTFVARHHWPTGEQVQRVQNLVKNSVWKGSLAAMPPTGRAGMSDEVAMLPVDDGGIGMPKLTHVLQELSVRVIARWATPGAGLRTEIGRRGFDITKCLTGQPRSAEVNGRDQPSKRRSLERESRSAALSNPSHENRTSELSPSGCSRKWARDRLSASTGKMAGSVQRTTTRGRT